MRINLKNIVCATDFSEFSDHAIPYGIALAKDFGAKLYICHIIDLPSVAIYDEAITDPISQQKRIMDYANEHIRRLISEHSIDWEPIITIGHASDEIARVAEEKRADLAIATSHGRSGLKRLILGSITERLMRTLSCPLLVVRGPEHGLVESEARGIKFQRILVGCDFSPDSDLALKYGLGLAQEFESELHLVHVIEPPVYDDLLKSLLKAEEEIQQDLRDRLKEELKKQIPEEAHNWCAPKTTLLAGQAHEELIKYAVVNDINLIVLGVRGHGLVETLLVGSTTDRVARQAPCPVLSVFGVTS